MKRTVRPSTPADAPAINALLTELGLRSNSDPQELYWRYWQARDDWKAPRSFVLLNGSQLIAHGALIPGTCVWGTNRERLAHLIDWAARRGEMGAGVTLMKHIGRQVGSLLAIGGSDETLQILPHIGFRPAGTATRYVRTLFPLRRLRSAERPAWKLLPRFARSVAWTLTAPAAATGDWRSYRALDVAELERIAPVVPKPGAAGALLERSVELLRYTLTCPIVPMKLYTVEKRGQVGGYFLLASAPGQVRIADCWMDSNLSTDWCAMIHCAVHEGKQDQQAAEIVIWSSEPRLSEALLACGFHARDTTPIQVRPAADGSMPPMPLRVQMLDNDAAYVHEGRRAFWA